METEGEGLGGLPPKGLWSPYSGGRCGACSTKGRSSLERHSNVVEFFPGFSHFLEYSILLWAFGGRGGSLCALNALMLRDGRSYTFSFIFLVTHFS